VDPKIMIFKPNTWLYAVNDTRNIYAYMDDVRYTEQCHCQWLGWP